MAGLLCIAVALVGCSSGDVGSSSDGPLLVSGIVSSGDDAGVEGRIRLLNACLELVSDDGSSYAVAWPGGTTWDAVEEAVRLSNGTSIQDGAKIRGGGGYVPIDAPGLDELLRSAASDCGVQSIVVLGGSADAIEVDPS